MIRKLLFPFFFCFHSFNNNSVEVFQLLTLELFELVLPAMVSRLDNVLVRFEPLDSDIDDFCTFSPPWLVCGLLLRNVCEVCGLEAFLLELLLLW